MPTSTATLTTTRMAKSPVSLRTTTSSKSAVATLRSLYPRAARAFLQRNVALTYSLLLSAFSNLEPPYSPSPDSLNSHRRKWDMLRITLETTLYTSAPQTDKLPEGLQSLLVLSPPSLLATMHTRSLQLFTPVTRGKPSSEFLPSQILLALVLASIKLECAQVGREMIEDWLSRRGQTQYNVGTEGHAGKDASEGYERVLEIYCLHVLPRLEDWDYAREFLRYENELPEDTKTYLVQSLQVLHAQHLENVERARERDQQLATPSPSSSRTPTPRPLVVDRAPSPSPSSASTSSNSTHTVVPHTPRPHPISSALTSLTPTPPAHTPTQRRESLSAAVTHRTSRSTASFPSPPSAPEMPVASISPPSLLVLLKSSIIPYLTASNVTFFILMFLVPFISFVFRLRRRRLRIGTIGGSSISVAKSRGSAAEGTRKRLKAGWWAEIRKAVTDTVKMAGSGIV